MNHLHISTHQHINHSFISSVQF